VVTIVFGLGRVGIIAAGGDDPGGDVDVDFDFDFDFDFERPAGGGFVGYGFVAGHRGAVARGPHAHVLRGVLVQEHAAWAPG
jgi:hypothetical protein